MTIKRKLNIGITILLILFTALGFVIYFQLKDKMEGTTEVVISVLVMTGFLDVFAFSAAINRSITKPITNLKNAMIEIGKGHLDTQIPVDSNDEIGQLAACFNDTIQKLKQTTTSITDLNLEVNKRKEAQDALQKAHKELENRVEERTVELSVANGELAKANYDLNVVVKKLSSTNKELHEFAHIVAHDLKTPLRGITNLASWLLSDYKDKIDEQGKSQLEMLVAKAKKTGCMIDDILKYSKAGKIQSKPKEVDLNILLKDLVSGLVSRDTSSEPQAASRESRSIEITVDENLPTVICDETQVMQVFQNLLTNAIKYMDKPEGKIHIGCQDDFASDPPCSRTVAAGEWKFSVSDNGPGIESRYFEKIFKIFQTVSSQEREDSTGIGLSIVKKIVENNGGQVWLESEVGKGTTFYFTFPKAESLLRTTV